MSERLTLEILTQATGQDSVDRLTTAMNRFATASESAATKATTSFKSVSNAAENTTGSMRRLFLATKDLAEGRKGFAMVEAGYFAQSLGGIGIAAGGAIAVIGALGYALYKFQDLSGKAAETSRAAFRSINDPLRTVNDGLKVANDHLANEIAKLEGRPQNTIALMLDETRLAADKLADSLDKDFAALHKVMTEGQVSRFNIFRAGDSGLNKREFGETGVGGFRAGVADLNGDPTKTRAAYQSESSYLQSELAKTEAAQKKESNPHYFDAKIEALKEYVREYNAEIEKIDLTTKNTGLEGQKDKAEAAKALTESNKQAATEATRALREGDEMRLGQMRASHKVNINEEIAFYETRKEQESGDAERTQQLTVKLGELYQQRSEKLGAVFKYGAAQEAEQLKKTTEWKNKNIGIMEEIAQAEEVRLAKAREQFSKLQQLKTQGESETRLSGMDQQRQSIGRAGALTPIGASQLEVVALKMQEYQQLKAIDQQEQTEKLSAKAKEITQLNDQDENYLQDRQKLANQLLQISRETNAKIYDDDTRMMEALHSERERQLGAFKSEVGGAFDAIMNRSFGGFLRSQAMGMGKTVVENLAAQALPSIEKMMPHAASGSFLGKILGGTPFGADPIKTATDLNTQATVDNTTALARIAMSASGGGGGSVGSLGGIFSGASSSNPFVFNATGTGGTFGGVTLPALGDNSDLDAINAAKIGNMKFGGSSLGGKLAGGAAAVGGAFAAMSDFRTGGARNDVAGAGALLGGAAGIAAMIPGGQVVALGLGIAAAATSIISGLMPDPKTIRETAIQNAIATNKYNAPTALNVSQDTSGNYVDFDAHGNLRQSSFRASPQVTDPSTFTDTHGLFGGPPTYYNVPGRVNSPYAPAQTTVIIQAADAQSFNDMAQRNAGALSDAVATHLQNVVPSRLTAAIQYHAGS